MKTPSVYRDIITHTSIYSISILAGKASSFILLPLYTRALTPSDYGTMELLELTSFILSAMVGMRIGDSLFYYYSKATTEEQKRLTISTILLGSILLGMAGGAIGWFGATYLSRLVFGSDHYAHYFRLVAAAFMFSPPAELGFCYIRALNRSYMYLFASIGRLALSITLTVLFVVFWRLGVTGVLWSGVLSAAAVTVATTLFCLSHIRFRVRFGIRLLGSFIRYSAPLGVSSLGVFIINYGDRFFLQRYVSLADIGIYALAYKAGMLITYLQMPFETYWRAQMFSIIKAPHGEKTWVRMCTYVALTLTFVVVLFALFARPMLHLVLPVAYWRADALIPWIAAAYVIRSVSGQFRYIFLIENKTFKDFNIISAGSVVCLLGYVLLIPPFKLWGAVASTLIGFSVIFVLGLWEAQRTRYFPFEFDRMVRLALVAICTVVVFRMIRPEPVWLDLAVGLLFSGAYLAILMWSGFLHRDERMAVKQMALSLQQASFLRAFRWVRG